MEGPFPFAGEASAAASSLLWAVSGIVFMRIRPQPGAGTINLGKNLTATGCFFLLLLVLGGRPWPARLGWEATLYFTASGFIGLAVCDLVLFRAFIQIGPRRTNVYMALWPAFVAGLAVLPPFLERPAPIVWLGIAVTLGGVVLAVLESPADAQARALLRRGARNALLASCLQAVGILIARQGHALSSATVAEAATIRLVSGSVGLIAIGLATGRLARWHGELRRPSTLWRVAVGGVLATFLGIWTNQAGIAWARHTGVAATLNSMAPIWLIPLSAAFLGERHDWRAWISALLAVGGIALMALG